MFSVPNLGVMKCCAHVPLRGSRHDGREPFHNDSTTTSGPQMPHSIQGGATPSGRDQQLPVSRSQGMEMSWSGRATGSCDANGAGLLRTRIRSTADRGPILARNSSGRPHEVLLQRSTGDPLISGSSRPSSVTIAPISAMTPTLARCASARAQCSTPAPATAGGTGRRSPMRAISSTAST